MGRELDGNSKSGVSMTAVFRTVPELGSCAQVAVALWDASQGSDVDVCLLIEPLGHNGYIKVGGRWQHVPVSLGQVLASSGDALDIFSAEGALPYAAIIYCHHLLSVASSWQQK
jgi:hypothetical protein